MCYAILDPKVGRFYFIYLFGRERGGGTLLALKGSLLFLLLCGIFRILEIRVNNWSLSFLNSSKKRKEYLVLTCGSPSLSSATPNAKEDEESCSDDDSSGDEENQAVSCL